MAGITVHGGDFEKGSSHSLLSGYLNLIAIDGTREKIPLSHLASVEMASEQAAKRFLGAAGLGLLGGFAIGPIGAVAGLLAGGNRKEVTFVAMLRDDRKMLATADSSTFTKLQAALFEPRSNNRPANYDMRFAPLQKPRNLGCSDLWNHYKPALEKKLTPEAAARVQSMIFEAAYNELREFCERSVQRIYRGEASEVIALLGPPPTDPLAFS